MDATDAVFCYDGRIELETGKVDAVYIEVRSYFMLGSKFAMAIPYSNDPTFKVYRSKIVQMEECEDFTVDNLVNSFWEGVDGHVEGARVWNDCMDQSI